MPVFSLFLMPIIPNTKPKIAKKAETKIPKPLNVTNKINEIIPIIASIKLVNPIYYSTPSSLYLFFAYLCEQEGHPVFFLPVLSEIHAW